MNFGRRNARTYWDLRVAPEDMTGRDDSVVVKMLGVLAVGISIWRDCCVDSQSRLKTGVDFRDEILRKRLAVHRMGIGKIGQLRLPCPHSCPHHG